MVKLPPSITALGPVATPSPSKGAEEALPARWGSSIRVTHAAATASPSLPFRRDRPLWALSAENTLLNVDSSVPATSLRSSTR